MYISIKVYKSSVQTQTDWGSFSSNFAAITFNFLINVIRKIGYLYPDSEIDKHN